MDICQLKPETFSLEHPSNAAQICEVLQLALITFSCYTFFLLQD